MPRNLLIKATKHGSKQPQPILFSADEGMPDIAAVKQFYTEEFGSVDAHPEYSSVELHAIDSSTRLRKNTFTKPKPVDEKTAVKPGPKANEKSSK